MRTSLFTAFPDLPDEFKEDFQVLVNLPADSRTALIPYVLKSNDAETIGGAKAALEEAVSKVSGPTTDVLRAFKCLDYVYRQWNPIVDTTAAFLQDLSDLGLVPSANEENRRAIESFFREFLNLSEAQFKERLKRSYAQAVLPSYLSVAALVDFRMVFKEPYGSRRDHNVMDYHPECVDCVPVIIVQIKRDSGLPTEFAFQCEESALQRLVDGLTAALRECKEAKAQRLIKQSSPVALSTPSE